MNFCFNNSTFGYDNGAGIPGEIQTPEGEILAATGIEASYLSNGRLVPLIGTGTLVISGGGVAEVDPGASVRADTLVSGDDFELVTSSTRFALPSTTDLSPGLLEDFLVAIDFARLPSATPGGQLVGKVDAGGLTGFELALGTIGNLIARVNDGTTVANAALSIFESHTNELRHVLVLAMLRSDPTVPTTATTRGTLWVASEMGISPPVGLPIDAINNAAEVFTLGMARTATWTGGKISHLVVSRGATLAAMAASGGRGVRDYAVNLDRLLNDQPFRWNTRNNWMRGTATGINNTPPTAVVIASGATVLVDNFTFNVQLTDSNYGYAAGIVSIGKSPGKVTFFGEWDGPLNGNALLTLEQRLGFFLNTGGEIIIKSFFRDTEAVGGGNQINTSFSLFDFLPPNDGSFPVAEIGPFASTDSGQSRTWTINNAAVSLIPLGTEAFN